MIDNPTTNQWTTARGDKWLTHISGTESMISPVDAPLIHALKLDSPYRIADIGCGGGATSVEISKIAPSGSVIHGFDVSPALIEYASKRSGSRHSSLGFKIADVATVNSPGELYDRLVSRFGIMFFDDPLAAFSNLRQWLKPGGRFAFAFWSEANANPWINDVKETVAMVVEIPVADPDAPGPLRYANADKLVSLLNHADYSGVGVTDWQGLFKIGGGLNAADAADFALASFASFGEILAASGNDAFANARHLLTEHFSDHIADDVVQMKACVHIITGSRTR